MVERFMAPGPWITREFRMCVEAADYDALAADNADNVRRMADDANKLHAAYTRIRELEAALHEIADFSEQFIADDDCMYKVNQIADTALAYAASGATTAANREGEHG